MKSGPDASNNSLPKSHPVIRSVPPLPSIIRGQRCPISANGNRLIYPSNKLVVVRSLLDAHLPAPHDKLECFCYRGHSQQVSACTMSNKSGAYIASADNKGSYKVWCYDHPEEHLTKYEHPTMLTGPILDIAWDSDNTRIVVCGERAPTDGSGMSAKAISWDTGNSLGQLHSHFKGRAMSCAIKPQRPLRVVTSGRDDGKLHFHQGPPFTRVVPTSKGQEGNGGKHDDGPTENAHKPNSTIHCVRYSMDGKYVCSVGADKSLCLYDGKTLSLISKLDIIHTGTIYACAFNNTGTAILTSSGDGTSKLFAITDEGQKLEQIQVWNVAEHQLLGNSVVDNKKVPFGGHQVGCAFLNGDIPVSVSYNGQFSILDIAEGKIRRTITGHNATLSDACFNLDGFFFTSDTDGIIVQWKFGQPNQRVHDGTKADLLYRCHDNGAAIAGITTLNQGQIVISVGWDDKLNVINAKTNVIQEDGRHALAGQPVCVSSGTNVACVVTVAGLHVVLVLSKDGKKKPAVVVGPVVPISYEANCITVSSDDTTVYVGGKDNTIHVYNVDQDNQSLTPKHEIQGHLKPIHALALSRDNTKLASGDEKDVCVWDVSDPTSISAIVSRGKWCFHTQRITALSWNVDGTLLASGGADDAIYLWNPMKKMRRIPYPFAHRGGIVKLHFTDNFHLISAGVDSVVNFWDVETDVKSKFG